MNHRSHWFVQASFGTIGNSPPTRTGPHLRNVTTRQPLNGRPHLPSFAKHRLYWTINQVGVQVYLLIASDGGQGTGFAAARGDTVPRDQELVRVRTEEARGAAQALGVNRSVVHRWRLSRKPSESGGGFALKASAILADTRVRRTVTETDVFETSDRPRNPVGPDRSTLRRSSQLTPAANSAAD